MSSGITFAFHHVVIRVTDMERSLKFYNELLGFVPERQHETADPALEAIARVKDAKVRTAFGSIEGVNLEFVEPICAPFEELNKHPGQALDSEPVRFSAGLRNTFTHDPDGASRELILRPADSPFR